MKAFLYHVLNNLIVDEYRKRKTTSLEALLETGAEPSMDTRESLFNRIDGKGALELISKLPDRYRKILKMKYIQDLSTKEMALLTGQSTNTVGVQVHRALNKLRMLYARDTAGSFLSGR